MKNYNLSRNNLIKFLLIYAIFSFLNICSCSKPPVIAILANPVPDDAVDILSSKVNYLNVRWLEQSRAEVVVIQPWHSKNKVEEILNKVNGVLLPGGDRNLKIGGQFENVAKYILDHVIHLYDTQGITLPLWGTCQGFELLHVLMANSTDVLSKYNAFNIRSALQINQENFNSARMFKDFSEKDAYNIQKYNLTAQFHNWGVAESEYEKFPILKKTFMITSYAKDLDNKTYINSVEGVKYPFYAVQFHPEMVLLKKELEGVPRSMTAVKLSQLFGNFYVEELSKNKNRISYEEMKKFDHLDSYKKIPQLLPRGYYYTFKKNDGVDKDLGVDVGIGVGVEVEKTERNTEYNPKILKKKFRYDI